MSLAKDIEEFYHLPHLSKDYKGLIYTFDLDKTYLITHFERLHKLVQIPFEKATHKKNIPGTAALVRELKKENAPLFFISGSPQYIQNVIKEKLNMDGVDFDGLLLKNFIESIRKLKLKKLVDKIGYKLAALLYGRSVFPRNSSEILFGDDFEHDATIYSFYSDIISGKFEEFEILTILKRWRVSKEEFNLIRKYLARLNKIRKKKKYIVKKIFIHLEANTPPRKHMVFSDKIIPTYNYFQTALVLYIDRYITFKGLLRVMNELNKKYYFDPSQFIFSVKDLLQRDILNVKKGEKLLNMFFTKNQSILPAKILDKFIMELSRILDTFSKELKYTKQDSFIHKIKRRGIQKKSPETDLLEKYFNYIPKNNL